jgi:hypothetical protein
MRPQTNYIPEGLGPGTICWKGDFPTNNFIKSERTYKEEEEENLTNNPLPSWEHVRHFMKIRSVLM